MSEPPRRVCPDCGTPLVSTPIAGSTNFRYTCPKGHAVSEVADNKGRTYLADGSGPSKRFLGG